MTAMVWPSLSADLISSAVSDSGARLMRSGMVGMMIKSAARMAASATLSSRDGASITARVIANSVNSLVALMMPGRRAAAAAAATTVGAPSLAPQQGASLRIAIEQEDFFALALGDAGQVNRQRRLPAPNSRTPRPVIEARFGMLCREHPADCYVGVHCRRPGRCGASLP
jgi:hypothetical protein